MNNHTTCRENDVSHFTRHLGCLILGGGMFFNYQKLKILSYMIFYKITVWHP